MSKIGTRKVKETQKIVFQSRFLEIRPKNFLTRYARQKTISAYISRKLDQKYTIVRKEWLRKEDSGREKKTQEESGRLRKIREFTSGCQNYFGDHEKKLKL